jgi:hypothetical protein
MFVPTAAVGRDPLWNILLLLGICLSLLSLHGVARWEPCEGGVNEGIHDSRCAQLRRRRGSEPEQR